MVEAIEDCRAIVTIVAGIPGVVATIAYFSRSDWTERPIPPPPSPAPRNATRPWPGPGRCQEFHVYKDGECQDVRLRDKN